MDPVVLTLLMCAAMLLVATVALSAFTLTQRSYHGHAWWVGALGLNAVAALVATLDETRMVWQWTQLLLVPWPVLCLFGLRRFHARLNLPGSERVEIGLLLVLLVGAATTTQALAGSDVAPEVPVLAASAALVYAATMVWRAPVEREASGLRVLGALWLTTAALPAIALPWLGDVFDLAVVQVCVVALASLVSTFVLMATSGQRTERELRESQRKLRVLANIDMLTQVPNRRRFEELARRAIRADKPGSAALLLVDIDHFKQVNDQLGHAAGDRALKLVSRCTLDLLRAQDVAGRHGGDEFVLLLRRSSTEDAMRVAERLASHLQSRALDYALPHLSLSFGIVQMRSGESIDDTLQRADLALYEAKRLGRSRAVAAEFDDDDDENPVFRSSQRLGLTSS